MHVVFVRTCICLGVVDALIAAAKGSSIAFIHRRGLRVARSTVLGNAKASSRGTDNKEVPRFFYVYT